MRDCEILEVEHEERWPRGRRHTPGERAVATIHPWVQIPPSPPEKKEFLTGTLVPVFRLFFSMFHLFLRDFVSFGNFEVVEGVI